MVEHPIEAIQAFTPRAAAERNRPQNPQRLFWLIAFDLWPCDRWSVVCFQSEFLSYFLVPSPTGKSIFLLQLVGIVSLTFSEQADWSVSFEVCQCLLRRINRLCRLRGNREMFAREVLMWNREVDVGMMISNHGMDLAYFDIFIRFFLFGAGKNYQQLKCKPWKTFQIWRGFIHFQTAEKIADHLLRSSLFS